MDQQMRSSVLKWNLEAASGIQLIGRGPVCLVATQTAGIGFLAVWTFEIWEGETPPEPTRRVQVFGTGHDIPTSIGPHRFVGSTMDGPFVWHIFEVPDELG